VTQHEFSALLLRYDSMINGLVMKFIGKIQRPHAWEFEDLKQEAIMKAWYKIKKFDAEKSGEQTFLYKVIHNAVYDVMNRSWKKPSVQLMGEEEISSLPNPQEYNKFEHELETLLSENVFEPDEIRYIQLTVMPPKGITQANFASPRQSRHYVRKAMRISGREEARLRNSIEAKLEKRLIIC